MSTHVLALWLLLTSCGGGVAQEGDTSIMPDTNAFDAAVAEARLREHLASLPDYPASEVARAADLDVGDFFAFFVIPEATGSAGEVLYLVGPDEMLTSGRPVEHFDRLMAALGVGTAPDVIDVETFARLFLRFRALRRGVVLDRADGHVLLQPGELPEDEFSPPGRSFDEAGARFHFWFFDTDRLEPVFFDVRVAPDGTTTVESSP